MGRGQYGKPRLTSLGLLVLLLGAAAGAAAPPASPSSHDLWAGSPALPAAGVPASPASPSSHDLWELGFNPAEALQRLQQVQPDWPGGKDRFRLPGPQDAREPFPGWKLPDRLPELPDWKLPELPPGLPPARPPALPPEWPSDLPPVPPMPAVPPSPPIPSSPAVPPQQAWPDELWLMPPRPVGSSPKVIRPQQAWPDEIPPRRWNRWYGWVPPGEGTPPQSDGRRTQEALERWWEQYVGPLEQTPEIRELLAQIIRGAEGLSFDLRDGSGNSLWDILRQGPGAEPSAGASGSSKRSQGASEDRNWLRRLGESVGASLRASLGEGGVSSLRLRRLLPVEGPSLRDSQGDELLRPGWMVLVLAGVLVGGILAVRRFHFRRVVAAASRSGAPPLVEQLHSREEWVRSIEHLCVRLLGQQVRFQTHRAIAAALRERTMVPSADIELLSRVYEWARYMPEQEPLPAETVETARQVLVRWSREVGA